MSSISISKISFVGKIFIVIALFIVTLLYTHPTFGQLADGAYDSYSYSGTTVTSVQGPGGWGNQSNFNAPTSGILPMSQASNAPPGVYIDPNTGTVYSVGFPPNQNSGNPGGGGSAGGGGSPYPVQVPGYIVQGSSTGSGNGCVWNPPTCGNPFDPATCFGGGWTCPPTTTTTGGYPNQGNYVIQPYSSEPYSYQTQPPQPCPTQSPSGLKLQYGVNGVGTDPTLCPVTYNVTATWNAVPNAGYYKIVFDDGSGKQDSNINIKQYNTAFPGFDYPSSPTGCTASDYTKGACAVITAGYYAHIYGLNTSKTYNWSVTPIGITNSGGACTGVTAGPANGSPINFTCIAACTDSSCNPGGTNGNSNGNSNGTNGNSNGGTTAGGTTSGGTGGGSTAAGGIYIDNNQSNCSDNTPYTGTAFSISLTGTYSQGNASYTYTGSTTEKNGSFIFTNLIGGQNAVYTLTPVLTSLPGYKVESISASGAVPISYNYPSGQFTLPDDTTSSPVDVTDIRVCLGTQKPWFQTSNGDVRMGTVKDDLPDNIAASTDTNNPSVFISNKGTANFGTGTPSTTHSWVINNEDTGGSGISNLGSTSYDFYLARAQQTGVQPKNLGTVCSAGNCGSLATGIYQSSGDFTLNNLTVPANSHITILVNGNLTINASTISVPKGSLLIIAAKNTITIAQSTRAAGSSATTSLEGIYTAEGSINMPTGASCPSTEDKPLTVAGTLIANSLNPFITGGTGTVSNSRNLCGDNGTTPSLVVTSRPDFLTALTDFYKSATKSLQEVNP